MAILWGASWPWGRVVAQAMPTFVASSVRFFFAIIPLICKYCSVIPRIVPNYGIIEGESEECSCI